MRPATRHCSSLFVAVALLEGLAFGAPAATSSPPRLAIGEVSAKTAEGEFSKDLRRALRDELLLLGDQKTRERFVLSAALLELTSEKRDTGVQATAIVSLAVRRAKDDTLHAVLSGRASTRAERTTRQAAEQTVLRAAVSRAFRRLAEAVR